MNIPVLYIFSGLPASGKSTLAKLLARKIGAMYLRVDTVEQGLRDLCNVKVEGYRLSYRVIRDNLELGVSCIADSCNPIELTRQEWQQVDESVDAVFVNIEVCCSDSDEHEYRVNTRASEVANLRLPNWDQVRNRHYEAWTDNVIRIDTSGQQIETSFSELVDKLGI
ncbi:AAA family ATPase [Vibrio rotiferianus]|uniref:AAA family ATPase n=1 Tax=Vibrio rotiferianus TaxID=190895 RepID=UPI00406A9F95